MICPSCGHIQADRRLICRHCGIVFAKYRACQSPPPADSARLASATPDGAPATWRRWLSPPPTDRFDPWAWTARAALLAVLTLWGLRLMGASVASNAAGESVLHLVNLTFHEAGHVFFRPFGEFLTSLGGTLGQLLMPLICALVLLLRTRDPFGASVALWWLGENFLDIAPYINDARAGVLPLLGGTTGQDAPYGFHDWHYVLTELGWLHLDQRLARISHGLGALIMLLALAWGGWLLARRWRVR